MDRNGTKTVRPSRGLLHWNLLPSRCWLYSFLAPGAHFAAIISEENSPFSLDEISNHMATVEAMTSNTLTDKLAVAVAAAQEHNRE